MANQRGDSVDFVNNGTVHIFIDGAPHRLRRPKVGEFKELRSKLWELQDAVDELIRAGIPEDEPAADEPMPADAGADALEVADEPEPVDEPEDPDDEQEQVDALIATAKEARRTQRHLNEAIDDLYADWVNDAVIKLADRPLPLERDNWPLFLTQQSFVTQLIEHWRGVPLARGAGSK